MDFRALTALLFFLFYFLYVWLLLEPAVEYYSQGVVFLMSGSFLRRFLPYPGGLVEYGAALLAQLNYQSWLGALVFTALGALLVLAMRWLCRRGAGRAPLFVCLAPSLALLAWRGRYDGRALAASLEILLALGGSLACPPLSRRPAWLRGPAVWTIGAVLYYAAGLWPFLLFAFLAGWFEALQNRKWLGVSALVFALLLIPVAWHALQFQEKTLNPWGTGLPLFFACVLFLLLPAALLVIKWRLGTRVSSDDPAPLPRHPTGSRTKGISTAKRRLAWTTSALAIGPIVAGCALVWFSFDGTRKALAQIEYCAALKEDERLLALAAKLKRLPPAAEIRVDLALYHRGRLTQDLFAFANRGKGALLPGMQMGIDATRPESQTLLELGQVNDAEHQAQELLESQGERPDILRMLAQVNILKDRPKAAAVFLNLLRQVPFQQPWAAGILGELALDPRLTGNRELDVIRSRMPTTDLPHTIVPTEDMLRQLLDSNPRNQMAFEYLLAQYLLTGNFAKLAQRLGQLDAFGYAAIPRNVEEALLLGQRIQGLQFDLRGRKIQLDTIQRFQTFCGALAAMPSRTPSALASLAPQFGDTFWYYYYSRLEIVNVGKANEHYPMGVAVRELIPRQSPVGEWERAYLMCDGSVQVATSLDGNFDEWGWNHSVNNFASP